MPRIAVLETDIEGGAAVHTRISEFSEPYIDEYFAPEGIGGKTPSFLVATYGCQTAGYAICYNRKRLDQTDANNPPEAPSLHLWLAGVVLEFRNLSVFAGLLKAVEAEAERRGQRVITVTSYRLAFPHMVHTLTKTHGYAIVDEDAAGKVRLRKDLPAF